ncbi:NETI motif-containing protein [Sporolactobacillus laevolacticus]|uniref:NETI motif-containing protein n=1 Tax=Sporolactobacillus laevolacticus TaxID=33018 RepID=UPI0025B2CCA8|nr:NETI motif-containing protein [Sporolactobacillus laevolacticus]MDN3955885.1 NETI motif-containing protein [Sporolactobacillus laevolacticus]
MSKKNKKNNQADQPLKKRFIVGDEETLDQCLDRMKREGYTPIRRTEQPIFQETANGPECIGRQCVLEGKLILSKDEQ